MEFILFAITAIVALVGAIAMIASPNAVHSALFLLLNFAAMAVLFLLLRAPFLFAIQLSIYAGAIMVLFLFVVMMLGAERAEDEQDRIAWQKPLAIVLGLVLLFETVYISTKASSKVTTDPVTRAALDTFGSSTQIGKVLFTKYLLPFEMAGIILLVAIVGVVVLNRGRQRMEQAAEPHHIEQATVPHIEQATALQQADVQE